MIHSEIITISPLSNADIFGIIHRNPKLFTCDANSKLNDNRGCENAITPYHIDHYCSNDESIEQWLEVIFPSEVKITNYTIVSTNQSSRPYSKDWTNPKAWKLFGFDENGEHLIHTVSESGLVDGDLITKTFPVDTIGIFTKVRLTLVEPYPLTNGNINSILRINKIDFFGTMKFVFHFTCFQRIIPSSRSLFITLLLCRSN